jgi:hypothetical protein
MSGNNIPKAEAFPPIFSSAGSFKAVGLGDVDYIPLQSKYRQ